MTEAGLDTGRGQAAGVFPLPLAIKLGTNSTKFLCLSESVYSLTDPATRPPPLAPGVCMSLFIQNGSVVPIELLRVGFRVTSQ